MVGLKFLESWTQNQLQSLPLLIFAEFFHPSLTREHLQLVHRSCVHHFGFGQLDLVLLGQSETCRPEFLPQKAWNDECPLLESEF